MRYGFQMDFHHWLNLLDTAIAHIERLENEKKTLTDQLTAKEKILQQQIELTDSLKQQLETASTAMFANAGELHQLQNKFNRLSSLVLPSDI